MEYIGSLVYDKIVLEGDVRFVIYGNGIMGKRLYTVLEYNGRSDRIDCFCDAKAELWGKTYRGIPIISPEEAVRDKKGCHFLVAGKYVEEQIRLLQEGGIKRIHVFLE